MRWTLLLFIPLGGCLWDEPPCEPEWYMGWSDPGWYNATWQRGDAVPFPVHVYDLEIQDPALDALYGRHITRNLQFPGGSLSHEDGQYVVRARVTVGSELIDQRDHLAPWYQALGLDVDATLTAMAANRSVVESVTSSQGTAVQVYGFQAAVEPALASWYHARGGLQEAERDDSLGGAWLVWGEWSLEVDKVGHTLQNGEVVLSVVPTGPVEARAPLTVAASDVEAAVTAWSDAHGLGPTGAQVIKTSCVELE